MELKLSTLADAQDMQIKLMAWETAFASHAMQSATEEELGEIKDLIERNPAYVANAYEYFHSIINTATSKKQILMAWVCGECDDKEKARAIYDEAMASNLSIKKTREKIKVANGNSNGHAAKRATLAEDCAGLVDTWNSFMDTKNDYPTAFDCASQLAALPAVASVLARRGKEEK